MKKQIITTAISLAMSACLYFGGDQLHAFAFYVLVVFSALAWIAVLTVGVKEDAAKRVRDGVWVSGASTVVQLSAMIATGHPILAASSFVCSALIVGAAFKEAA